MQILQESTPNHSKSTQPPLPPISGVWPPKNGPYVCCDGRKPEAAPGRNLKKEREDKTLLSIPRHQNISLYLWLDQLVFSSLATYHWHAAPWGGSELARATVHIREGIIAPRAPCVYPSCSLKLPNTSLFALITSTLTSADCDPALHINYCKRGRDLLIAPDD